MIDKVNDEFIVDCTNNSKEERQQVYKFLVDNRNYDKGYLGKDFSIIVCNKKQGNTNWRILSDAKEINGKNYNVYTFEQFKKMYLEEEFVLPEKWCIEVTDENRDILNNYRINIKKYSITPITYKYMYKDGSGDSFTLFYAKEITFEQFLKYILKQETMEKEIIGYKTPYNMYGGQVKKGDIWTLNKYDNGYQSNANVTDLPKEIVEQWEKVYKEEKTIVKMYSSNKGEFEIEVVGKKAYYRPDNKELTKEFIEEILDWFDDSINHSYDSRTKLLYSLTVQSLKVGCMEGTRQTDWLKVYDLIK